MQESKPKDEECGTDDDDLTAKRKRSYYYDDAHGYEEYDPKKNTDVEDDEFDD